MAAESGRAAQGRAFLWHCDIDGPVDGPLLVATGRGDDSARRGAGLPRREGPAARPGDAVAAAGDHVRIEARAGRLVVSGDVGGSFTIDMEDTRLFGRHQLVVLGDGAGTAFYLDGYVVWATRRFLLAFSRRVGVAAADARVAVRVEDAHDLHPGDPHTETMLRDGTPTPRPIASFVAPELAAADAAAVGGAAEYVLHARFRVRGPGQYGTILAAARDGRPVLRAAIDAAGIALERDAAPTLTAPGAWSDGRWHHLAVTCVEGATQVWVDGWLRAHAPGRAVAFDHLTVGQDLRGERLMGEVAEGGVHGPLNDQQIALLARRPVVPQIPVFDHHPDGAYHRIPVLLRLDDGTLLALADARHGLPNDAPNVTDLVASRSADGGRTWAQPATVLGYPGDASAPVCVTDAAAVQDAHGRIHVLADLYAAGLGLLNARPGAGIAPGVEVGVDPDGTLREPEGGACLGSLHERGTPATEVGHVAHLVSEDGGRTWGAPRLVTAQIKDAWMPFLGLGPGAGIRLRSAPHTGRLVVPCYFADEAAAAFSAAALLSDDDGCTWRRGASTNADRVVDGEAVDERHITDPRALMSEASIVELEDGTLLMVARSQRPHLLRAISRDGGETWGEITEDVPTEIFCQPAATARDDVVYVANAARMLPYRGCGTVYRTEDLPAQLRHRTAAGDPAPLAWRSLAVNPRHHGYQSLAPTGDGVAMLWERETAGVWFSVVPDRLWD